MAQFNWSDGNGEATRWKPIPARAKGLTLEDLGVSREEKKESEESSILMYGLSDEDVVKYINSQIGGCGGGEYARQRLLHVCRRWGFRAPLRYAIARLSTGDKYVLAYDSSGEIKVCIKDDDLDGDIYIDLEERKWQKDLKKALDAQQ